MFDNNNPELIQDPFPGQQGHDAPPLVLIHDGGGTVVSYHFLDPLHRTVYGISNPHFYTKEPFPGGLVEVGTQYAKFIKSVIPSGPVILGGWSFGGLVSIQVARVLADDMDLDVIGIVMIDSVCPRPPPGGWESGLRCPLVKGWKIEWNPNTKQETREAVEWCFSESSKMSLEWVPPVWAPSKDQEGEGEVAGGVYQAPPVFLLKSRDHAPAEGGILLVDYYRRDEKLGWDNYHKGLVQRVLDIPGQHFAAFAMENLETVTEQLNSALQWIEEEAGYLG